MEPKPDTSIDVMDLVVQRPLCTKNSVFWEITPCSPLKVNQHLGRTCRLHLQGRRLSKARNWHEASRMKIKRFVANSAIFFTLVSYLAYSSTIKIETCYSETSVDLQRTTWSYIPEDKTLYKHRCKNLISVSIPRGGGFEYFHRSLASRKRRRKEKPVPGGITGPPYSWGI
jgi:hypothetical protein